MKTFVFPGQGSQQKGMGGSLFEEFKQLTDIADAVLGYSIKKLCMEDPGQQLIQTQYTQPALFTVNALTYLRKISSEGKPDYLAGHSLGEYNALFAAGAFDFETGLKMVQKRGALMSQTRGGGMAAVIGLIAEKVEEVIAKNNLTAIQIANYNSPSQIVLSGPGTDIRSAGAFFESAGGRYIPLAVSGAFHSRYMDNAKIEFEKFLDSFTFSRLTIPVISNVSARPYKTEDFEKSLAAQITHSVKWTESIRYLMGRGEMVFEEVGPGTVLTRLIQTIRKEASPLIVPDKEEEIPPK